MTSISVLWGVGITVGLLFGFICEWSDKNGNH